GTRAGGPVSERDQQSYEGWSLDGWRTHLPGVADVREFAADLGDQSVPELAASSAARFPGRVAVTVDGEPVTHAGLDQDAGRVAAWLARRVAPGDRVLLAARSSLGFVRCYLGALRAGAVVVLANPAYTAAELAHLVTDSAVTVAFADSGHARLLAGMPNAPLTVDTAGVPGAPGLPRIVTRPATT